MQSPKHIQQVNTFYKGILLAAYTHDIYFLNKTVGMHGLHAECWGMLQNVTELGQGRSKRKKQVRVCATRKWGWTLKLRLAYNQWVPYNLRKSKPAVLTATSAEEDRIFGSSGGWLLKQGNWCCPIYARKLDARLEYFNSEDVHVCRVFIKNSKNPLLSFLWEHKILGLMWWKRSPPFTWTPQQSKSGFLPLSFGKYPSSKPAEPFKPLWDNFVWSGVLYISKAGAGDWTHL